MRKNYLQRAVIGFMACLMLTLVATTTARAIDHFFWYAANWQYQEDYTQEIRDHSTAIFLVATCGSDAQCIADWYIDRINYLRSINQKAVIDCFFIFFTDLSNPSLRVDWESRWAIVADALAPYANDIITFYPIDEPIMHGISPETVEMVAFAIKSRFPGNKVSLINHPMSAGFTTPSLDWVGFDCYSCSMDELAAHSAQLRANLWPHQRMIWVPKAFSEDPADQHLLCRFYQEWNLIAKEPLIDVIVPFRWSSQVPGYGYGARDLLPHFRNAVINIARTSIPGGTIYRKACPSTVVRYGPPERREFHFGYPIASYLAFDQDPTTFFAVFEEGKGTGGIDLNFGSRVNAISRIRLQIQQNRPGITIHELWISTFSLEHEILVDRLEGFTSSGDWIEFNTYATGFLSFRVYSWAQEEGVIAGGGWKEIQIF